MASETLLGLFDGYMPLARDGLTSETKIGGSAVYFPPLTAEHRKTIDGWTTCGVCGHRMFLLLQAYSPLPSMEAEAHHNDTNSATAGWNRMLYVFCCNSSSCARQPSSSWCAFSVQVDREDTAADDDDDDDGESGEPLPAPLPKDALPRHAFPPCYVYVDGEPQREEIVPTDLEREMAKMAEANARVDGGGGGGIREEDLAELEKHIDLKDKKSDYYYEKFRSRLARAPTQVLRYHQRPAPSGPAAAAAASAAAAGEKKKEERPLFMNPDKVKRFLTVPPCASCGGVLVHELQLMPTTLFYLKVAQYVNRRGGGAQPSEEEPVTAPSSKDAGARSIASVSSASSATSLGPTAGTGALKSTGDDGVDFGTATVYVCAAGCAMRAGEGVHLRREVVCVEEPPSIRDDRLEAQREGGRKDLRQFLEEDDDADDDGEAPM